MLSSAYVHVSLAKQVRSFINRDPAERGARRCCHNPSLVIILAIIMNYVHSYWQKHVAPTTTFQKSNAKVLQPSCEQVSEQDCSVVLLLARGATGGSVEKWTTCLIE
jgi:hypothetical protein